MRSVIQIPGDTMYLGVVKVAIEKLLDLHRCKGREKFFITLAVSEAVTNSVIHGNKSEFGNKVVIEFEMEDGAIDIKVWGDSKVDFRSELSRARKREGNVEGRKWGLHLVHKYMDSVRFIRQPTGETGILMSKNIK